MRFRREEGEHGHVEREVQDDARQDALTQDHVEHHKGKYPRVNESGETLIGVLFSEHCRGGYDSRTYEPPCGMINEGLEHSKGHEVDDHHEDVLVNPGGQPTHKQVC